MQIPLGNDKQRKIELLWIAEQASIGKKGLNAKFSTAPRDDAARLRLR
jgi:hypothetical protein